MMEIGIDSFAAWSMGADGQAATPAAAMQELVQRVVRAEECGLDVFGIGEHHRKEFLDSAPAMILAAAAARTSKITLTSAVIGKERGDAPVTRAAFNAQTGPPGALLVGSPQNVAEKILRFSEALGG
jgi:alkanesulfonate monooxygenase SsuD/methylene tetrahydromethanopterin reductase-like flavin-dependent oxidoreductase (luciferase family)